MLNRRRRPRPEDPNLDGRRGAPRVRVALPAAAETVSGRKRVRLLNLSRTGAMLEGPNLPEVGQHVYLKSGAVDVFATVIWSSDGRCGITFDHPVREEQVQRLKLAGEWNARTGVNPNVQEPGEDSSEPA